MLLYVEEFKATPQRHLDFEVVGKELSDLLSGTDFTLVDKLELSADIERLGSTFRIVADLKTTIAYTCGRCLEKREQSLEIETDWVLMEKGEFAKKYATNEEIELSAEDLDVSVYQGDEIDLTDLVRESILLELPTYARCPEGDAQCDADFEKNVGKKALEKNDDAAVDLRWSALKDLQLKSKE